jgi:hypothetical protein
MTALAAAPQALGDQRRLADPRLARDIDGAAVPVEELVERSVEHVQLGVTPDEAPARRRRA